MSNIIDRDADLSICQAADELERLRAENARKSAQSTQQWEAGMGKWTQGPWLYRPQPYDDWGSVRNGDGYLVAVAANPSISEHQYAEHRAARTDPYEANARLIAAAPDLLAFAKELLRHDGEQGSEDYHALKVYDARERLRAAIAAAEAQP